MLNESLATSENPPIHHILTFRRLGVVCELLACALLIKLHLAKVEIERVDPLKNHAGENFADAFFSESEIVSPDDRRVDEEQSDAVGTELGNDLHWVGIVL